MIVTCTSIHSRNFRCGRLLGKGYKPEDAIKEIGMVSEGMYTAEVVKELSEQTGVDMPIFNAIYDVINGNITVQEAMEDLMCRPIGREADYL